MPDDVADYVAIRRLQDAFADTVTRGAWHELSEMFTADATITVHIGDRKPITVVGAAALSTFTRQAISGLDFFQFVILNTQIALEAEGDANAARARVYICEERLAHSTGAWSRSFGVYLDDYVRVDDRWRFSERIYYALARTDPGAPVYPYPPAEML
jgi:hypothetical protein